MSDLQSSRPARRMLRPVRRRGAPVKRRAFKLLRKVSGRLTPTRKPLTR